VQAIFAVSRAELKRFRTIDGDTVGQIAAEFNHLNIIQHLHEIEPTLSQERNDQGQFWLAQIVLQSGFLGFTTAGVACKNGRIKILQWMVTNIDSVAAELQPKGNDY